MDVKQLRYFLGVMSARSITKASQQLHVAQPALGLQIRNLEEELGVELFVRHSRGVTPTEAGRLLAEHARVLVRQLERAKQEMVDYAGEPRGRVGVGMTNTLSLVVAGALAELCRRRYPEISLNIAEGLSERLMEWVEADRIDMTLTYNPDAVKGLVCRPLIREKLFFVNGGGSGRRNPRAIGFARALEQELVLPSHPHLLRTLIDETARARNLSPRIVFEIDSVPAIKELVLRGLGTTILPFGAVWREVDAGVLEARPVANPVLKRTLSLAYAATRPTSKAFNAVAELIGEVVEDLARTRKLGWELVGPRVAARSEKRGIQTGSGL